MLIALSEHIIQFVAGLFGFAGLWERWKDKASGEVIRSCTIITTEPNEVCAPIHNRMPVIVAPEDYGRWLGEVATDLSSVDSEEASTRIRRLSARARSSTSSGSRA